jgi:hypothetical protein
VHRSNYTLSPKVGRIFHLAMMVFWFSQIIIVPFFVSGWKLYLLEISLYANFVGHWSGLSAERPSEIVDS